MRSRILLVLLIVVATAVLLTGYLLGGRPRFVHQGAGLIVVLQADGRGLVWLETEGADPGQAGRIFTLDEGGRSPRAIYSEPRARNLTLNGDRVLAAASDGGSGELLSISRSGGESNTIAGGLSQPGGLCADGGSVYWTETNEAPLPHVSHIPALLSRTVLKRCSVDGRGAPQTLAAIEGSADGSLGSLLGLHDERLYWIDVSGTTRYESWSAIRSIPSTGGSVETLAREKGISTGLLEGDSLYWTAPSEDAGDVRQYCCIRRASVPEGAPVTLTDWLMPGGSLYRFRGRVYYSGADGLWTVPERLGLPRQVGRTPFGRGLAVGWRGALYEVVPIGEGQDGLLRRPFTVGARLKAAIGSL